MMFLHYYMLFISVFYIFPSFIVEFFFDGEGQQHRYGVVGFAHSLLSISLPKLQEIRCGPLVIRTKLIHGTSSILFLKDSENGEEDEDEEKVLEMTKSSIAKVKTKRRSQPKVKGSSSSSATKSSPGSGSKKEKSKKKKQKKSASKTKKKNAVKKEKYYWSDDSDKVIFSYFHDDGEGQEEVGEEIEKGQPAARQISKIHFKVRGNPRPLRRHRTSRGFTYNPSQKFQQEFYDVVKTIVFDVNPSTTANNNAEVTIDNTATTKSTTPAAPAAAVAANDEGLIRPSLPLFDENEILVMTIVFRLRRPRNHFIGNKAGVGRMRASAPHCTYQTRTDVDNLIKFVLDSMNQLLYEDDRQIMSIKATKILDDEGLCEGSTEIVLESIHKDDVQAKLLTL